MNKTDLINVVAANAGVSKKNAEAVIKATLDAITTAMTNGESVQLLGFGSFEVRERAERTGHNPKTGEAVKIAACKTPVFKPGKPLKDAVNK